MQKIHSSSAIVALSQENYFAAVAFAKANDVAIKDVIDAAMRTYLRGVLAAATDLKKGGSK